MSKQPTHLQLALLAGLSAPFGVAVILTAAVMPTAYQAALTSCLTIDHQPGLPTPVTPSAEPDPGDCVPATGELPPGPDGTCRSAGGRAPC